MSELEKGGYKPTTESEGKSELNDFGSAWEESTIDMVSRMELSEEERRQAVKDALTLDRAFHQVLFDTQGIGVAADLQGLVDEVIERQGLDPNKFNLNTLTELIRREEE